MNMTVECRINPFNPMVEFAFFFNKAFPTPVNKSVISKTKKMCIMAFVPNEIMLACKIVMSTVID